MNQNESCCETFQSHIERTCDQHSNPYDCADAIVIKNANGFGIPIHDGGSSFIGIAFCPWCGSRFKKDPGNLGFRDIPRLNMSRRAKIENLEKFWLEVKRVEADKSDPDFDNPLDQEELLLLSWYLGWIDGVKGNFEREVYENSKALRYGIRESDSTGEALEKIHNWHMENADEVELYGSVKQVLVVRKDLNMRKGKMIAQAAHAAMLSLLERRVDSLVEGQRKATIDLDAAAWLWLRGSYAKVVVGVDSEAELLGLLAHAQEKKLRCALVLDEGRTEVIRDTVTALAIGPDLSTEIDKVTGHLKLL